MQVFLVGGAIRNQLLGLPVLERDWVVVGAHPEDLLHQGFKQVGKDFPVFLHPTTHEQYALARKERKTGVGYCGFYCDFGSEVRLEEDLMRRDLRINAIAQDIHGNLIDPFGGLDDLQHRRLRHVSPAFVEDPLRVLRVARLASSLAPLGFSIDPDTMELMRILSQSGELRQLSTERIWKETARALMTEQPEVYFQVLHQVDALYPLFPELANLTGVPQNPYWHPEIDTGEHIMLSLHQCAIEQAPLSVRFAVLVHDLGKAQTATEHLPHHPEHGVLGLPLIRQLCNRLHIPAKLQELALLVAELHLDLHRLQLDQPNSDQMLYQLITRLDGLRRPQRTYEFVQACRCDVRGRLHHENVAYPQGDRLLAALQLLQQNPVHKTQLQSMPIHTRAEFIKTQRLDQLRHWLTQ